MIKIIVFWLLVMLTIAAVGAGAYYSFRFVLYVWDSIRRRNK